MKVRKNLIWIGILAWTLVVVFAFTIGQEHPVPVIAMGSLLVGGFVALGKDLIAPEPKEPKEPGAVVPAETVDTILRKVPDAMPLPDTPPATGRTGKAGGA